MNNLYIETDRRLTDPLWESPRDSGDHAVDDAFDEILRSARLNAVFQPVVCLGRRAILGYEGLIRGPAGSPLFAPDALFAAAARRGRLVELDFLCRETVIREFARHGLAGLLFINIHPLTLSERRLINGHTLACLIQHGLDPARVIIEITETHPINDVGLFQDALGHYRDQGFRVALDDLGAGYSGLKLWSESNPDYVKVDRHFIAGVDHDRTKQRFISAILEIAKSMGCETITEGIENKQEYAVLRKLGVVLAQGYYFARPAPVPPVEVDPGLFSDRPVRPRPHQSLTAGSLLKACPSIGPDDSIGRLGELFQSNAQLKSVAVVEQQNPLGLIVRDDFMSLMASRYGRDLYHRKPVRQLIQRRAVSVDVLTSLEDISQRLTSALNHYADEFIITEQGHYLGKGTLMDLLGKITELQVKKARYANPLTLLPGNVVIQQTLAEAIEQAVGFAVAYLDLDNFKPYNDAYGYAHGDEILRLVARLLQEGVSPEADFVGHIGGDDFILLLYGGDWQERCQRILQIFRELVSLHYTEEDRERGGITAADRFGITRQFPIMSLSIGVLLLPQGCSGLTPERVAELASRAKSRAKRRQGNTICADTYECPRLGRGYSGRMPFREK